MRLWLPKLVGIERFAFYEAAKKAFAVVQAGDLRAAIEEHAPDLPLYRELVRRGEWVNYLVIRPGR